VRFIGGLIDISTNIPQYRVVQLPQSGVAYYLPESGGIDLRGYGPSSWLVLCNVACDVVLEFSLDNENFYELQGYSIASADFVVNKFNTIDTTFNLYYARLKVTPASAGGVSLSMVVVKRI